MIRCAKARRSDRHHPPAARCLTRCIHADVENDYRLPRQVHEIESRDLAALPVIKKPGLNGGGADAFACVARLFFIFLGLRAYILRRHPPAKTLVDQAVHDKITERGIHSWEFPGEQYPCALRSRLGWPLWRVRE